MNKIKTYNAAWCLVLVLLAFAACKDNSDERKMPNMYPPYIYRDKGPMGTNIAYRLLPGQFNADISLASKKMKGSINEFSYVKNTAYISIGKNLTLGNEELEQLLDYVQRGNEFFISASSLDYRMLDTLGVKQGYESFMENGIPHKRNTSLQIADTLMYGKKKYGFFYFPFSDIFSRYDSSMTKVLGVNENGHANYIVVRYGKGKFYFHTEPAAFSNYFLLTGGNTDYFSQVFSYLNKDAREVFWGDIYRFGQKADDFSALAIFWKNPPLRYALLIACSLMLLYIAFGSKRKRRLVPALPPNNNASLSFVQTIGNLYLQKKDNRNIAVKMMSYFFEHIRSHYHLGTSNINTEFIQALSRKSGVAEKTVQALMEKADDLNNTERITDHELFEINNLIDAFYKR